MLCLLLAAEQDIATSVAAVSGDGSTLIVRGTHTELVDGEATVVSQFLVVDVVSGQLVGTVGQPCYGVSPATAEFIGHTRMLFVTCEVSPRPPPAGEISPAKTCLLYTSPSPRD